VGDEHLVAGGPAVPVSAGDDERVDRARVPLQRAVRLQPQARPRGDRVAARGEQADVVARLRTELGRHRQRGGDTRDVEQFGVGVTDDQHGNGLIGHGSQDSRPTAEIPPLGIRRRGQAVVMKTLAHRWPTAVGLIAAVAIFLESPDRAEVALVAAIAATCYVAAATFALPWMAWVWIPIGFVVVAAGRLVGLHPLVATGVTAVALVAVGLLRTRTRPGVTLETAGLLLYGALAVLALLLAPAVGLVVVALTLIAHGAWDLWHLRRHRELVSPSLAEACVALDVPLGLAVLVVALV